MSNPQAWQFDPQFTRANQYIFDFIESKSIWSFIYYIIDSRVRKSVSLVSWLNDQVVNPSEKLLEIASKIDAGSTYDETVYNVLNYVQTHLNYVSDSVAWKATEYWATANEIAETMRDDCDGGATLMYVLCRIKGVPANRLLLMAGNVFVSKTAPNGGHCWLAYRSDYFPLNWCFIDWCYNVELSPCQARSQYYVKDQTIYSKAEKYKEIWFAFNEDKSYVGLMNN